MSKLTFVKEAPAVHSYAVYQHGQRPASYGVYVDGARRGALVGLPGSYRRGSYRVELDGRSLGRWDRLRDAKYEVECALRAEVQP